MIGLSSPRATRLVFDRIGLLYCWLTNNQLWRDSLREMSRHLPPGAANLRVLDIGCGPGNSTLRLLEYRPDLRITGLDISAGMLKRARLKTNIADRAMWAQADIAHLPLSDSSMDAIVGHSVFYMIADRTAFLGEALRVLRPGGRLILLDPVERLYPLDAVKRWRSPRSALSVLVWHAVSRLYRRFTLEQMAHCLTGAGFARVLAERAVEGYGVLSRGEKPYPNLSSVERIAQTAAQDNAVDDLQIVDSDALATIPLAKRHRFVFLLVKQAPDKPAWAIQPGETIHWEAAMITDQGDSNRPYLLVFTSLPKAVEFMQPAVTSGLLKGINKIAKFDKGASAQWKTDLLLNPSFEMLRASGRYKFTGSLHIDPASAVTPDE